MKLRWLKSVSVVVLALLAHACAPDIKPEQSCSFVQNSQGQRVSWKGSLPIVLYIHESFPIRYRPALEASIRQWEDKFNMNLFSIGGWTNGQETPSQDSWNIIYWIDDWEDDRKFEQARTSIYWVGDQIREADIRVNSRDFKYFWNESAIDGRVDIESLLTHELGHALGLAHSENSGTVMAATLANSVKRREVGSTDLDSLSCEY